MTFLPRNLSSSDVLNKQLLLNKVKKKIGLPASTSMTENSLILT